MDTAAPSECELGHTGKKYRASIRQRASIRLADSYSPADMSRTRRTKNPEQYLTKEQQKACLDSAAAELIREITQQRPSN